MTDLRRRIYDQQTTDPESSPWSTALWGLALYGHPNGPDDDDVEIREFGGSRRSLWERSGIRDLTG